MSEEKVLTRKEAYLAMFSFLDEYYQVNRIDAIGSFLSSMSLMADGEPMDIAFSA